MYLQLPSATYPRTIFISHTVTFAEAAEMLTEENFNFPVAVKPDVGMMGLMFRKIENMAQFEKYHSAIQVDYIVQHYIDYPLEVSVFYYRFPHEASGHITGFIRKEFLQVKGNGVSTLWELIQQYPRVRFRLEEMKLKHEKKLNDVIPEGEIYCLSYAMNLSRGGKLVSIEQEKDDRLLKVFDGLSHYARHFYYGRYDIKCSSVEDLKQGKRFAILEYNGSGAEPHHIYGNGHTLLRAYRIVLHHWQVLYKISKMNRRSGITYWPFSTGFKFLKNAKNHFKVLRKLDTTFEL